MDLNFLTEYMVPVIVGLCLCTGYVIKRWIDDVDNRWIPTVLAVEGILVACWINMNVTPEILLSGAMSGLVSVGLHQVFKTVVEGGKRNV